MMYPSSTEQFFMELINKNKVYVNTSENIIRIEDLIKCPRETTIKNHKYVTITHKGKIIFLLRFMYMYYTKGYVPKNYYILPDDGDIYNYDFNNLKLVTKDENIRRLNLVNKYPRTNEHKLAVIERSRKIDLKSVEYYRCQYHQQKMTKNEIIEKTNLSRKTVNNFLNFKSFSFDPITGDYDPTLKDLYTTKNGREIKQYKVIRPKSIKDNISVDELLHIKKITFPLSFDSIQELYSIYKRKNLSYKVLCNSINTSPDIIRKYIAMYKFYINIFPNYKLIDMEENNTSFHKFVDKYQRYFENAVIPSIKPYSFKMFIRNIPLNDISSMHKKYKNNEKTIEELSDEFNIDQIKVKFAIIEYDRYLRLYSEERLSPEQFNKVYKYV